MPNEPMIVLRASREPRSAPTLGDECPEGR
jgi:hypothetical protein